MEVNHDYTNKALNNLANSTRQLFEMKLGKSIDGIVEAETLLALAQKIGGIDIGTAEKPKKKAEICMNILSRLLTNWRKDRHRPLHKLTLPVVRASRSLPLDRLSWSKDLDGNVGENRTVTSPKRVTVKAAQTTIESPDPGNVQSLSLIQSNAVDARGQFTQDNLLVDNKQPQETTIQDEVNSAHSDGELKVDSASASESSGEQYSGEVHEDDKGYYGGDEMTDHEMTDDDRRPNASSHRSYATKERQAEYAKAVLTGSFLNHLPFETSVPVEGPLSDLLMNVSHLSPKQRGELSQSMCSKKTLAPLLLAFVIHNFGDNYGITALSKMVASFFNMGKDGSLLRNLFYDFAAGNDYHNSQRGRNVPACITLHCPGLMAQLRERAMKLYRLSRRKASPIVDEDETFNADEGKSEEGSTSSDDLEPEVEIDPHEVELLSADYGDYDVFTETLPSDDQALDVGNAAALVIEHDDSKCGYCEKPFLEENDPYGSATIKCSHDPCINTVSSTFHRSCAGIPVSQRLKWGMYCTVCIAENKRQIAAKKALEEASKQKAIKEANMSEYRDLQTRLRDPDAELLPDVDGNTGGSATPVLHVRDMKALMEEYVHTNLVDLVSDVKHMPLANHHLERMICQLQAIADGKTTRYMMNKLLIATGFKVFKQIDKSGSFAFSHEDQLVPRITFVREMIDLWKRELLVLSRPSPAEGKRVEALSMQDKPFIVLMTDEWVTRAPGIVGKGVAPISTHIPSTQKSANPGLMVAQTICAWGTVHYLDIEIGKSKEGYFNSEKCRQYYEELIVRAYRQFGKDFRILLLLDHSSIHTANDSCFPNVAVMNLSRGGNLHMAFPEKTTWVDDSGKEHEQEYFVLDEAGNKVHIGLAELARQRGLSVEGKLKADIAKELSEKFADLRKVPKLIETIFGFENVSRVLREAGIADSDLPHRGWFNFRFTPILHPELNFAIENAFATVRREIWEEVPINCPMFHFKRIVENISRHIPHHHLERTFARWLKNCMFYANFDLRCDPRAEDKTFFRRTLNESGHRAQQAKMLREQKGYTNTKTSHPRVTGDLDPSASHSPDDVAMFMGVCECPNCNEFNFCHLGSCNDKGCKALILKKSRPDYKEPEKQKREFDPFNDLRDEQQAEYNALPSSAQRERNTVILNLVNRVTSSGNEVYLSGRGTAALESSWQAKYLLDPRHDLDFYAQSKSSFGNLFFSENNVITPLQFTVRQRLDMSSDLISLVLWHDELKFRISVDLVVINPTWQKDCGTALWSLQRTYDDEKKSVVYKHPASSPFRAVSINSLVKQLKNYYTLDESCYDALADDDYEDLFVDYFVDGRTFDMLRSYVAEQAKREGGKWKKEAKFLRKLVDKIEETGKRYQFIRKADFKEPYLSNKRPRVPSVEITEERKTVPVSRKRVKKSTE